MDNALRSPLHSRVLSPLAPEQRHGPGPLLGIIVSDQARLAQGAPANLEMGNVRTRWATVRSAYCTTGVMTDQRQLGSGDGDEWS